MTTLADFKYFWSGTCVDKSLPLALCYFIAAHLLACPSACEAERAISTLKRIATALRSNMT